MVLICVLPQVALWGKGKVCTNRTKFTTVGLSLGLTPHLGIVSQGILIFLMFIGRVGGLTMIYAALSGSKSSAARLPQERITVG